MSRGARLAMLLAVVLPATARAEWRDWWWTPAQQGQRLLEQGRYAEAAQRFTDPERIGAAWYQAKEFERAAAAFGRSTTPEAAYNRGNALVLLGRYDDAIASFRSALSLRPDWREAVQNLSVAEARKAALAPPDDDFGGTEGQLEADGYVFDDTPPGDVPDQPPEEAGAGEQASQAALRALWLRRVDTSPADFLAAKFAYQLAVREEGE